ncbi:hypothetical protein [Nitrosomonas sp. HPC101]|nr:hypothetical protein [Nitrosomonas sp. HPC101]
MQNNLHHVEKLFEITILNPAHLNKIITEVRELLTMLSYDHSART